ncbi:hypothetical protein GY45DRAFT_638472 [Cubamyces sp. BRFM 1775]|nr:hypothetical protein GY45DRAFT_638472 [Cubamyces sp. BRFM 1775]
MSETMCGRLHAKDRCRPHRGPCYPWCLPFRGLGPALLPARGSDGCVGVSTASCQSRSSIVRPAAFGMSTLWPLMLRKLHTPVSKLSSTTNGVRRCFCRDPWRAARSVYRSASAPPTQARRKSNSDPWRLRDMLRASDGSLVVARRHSSLPYLDGWPIDYFHRYRSRRRWEPSRFSAGFHARAVWVTPLDAAFARMIACS